MSPRWEGATEMRNQGFENPRDSSFGFKMAKTFRFEGAIDYFKVVVDVGPKIYARMSAECDSCENQISAPRELSSG